MESNRAASIAIVGAHGGLQGTFPPHHRDGRRASRWSQEAGANYGAPGSDSQGMPSPSESSLATSP